MSPANTTSDHKTAKIHQYLFILPASSTVLKRARYGAEMIWERGSSAVHFGSKVSQKNLGSGEMKSPRRVPRAFGFARSAIARTASPSTCRPCRRRGRLRELQPWAQAARPPELRW